MSDDDNDLDIKQDKTSRDKNDKYINKGLLEYVPKILVKLGLFGVILLGFIIGYILVAVLLSFTLCAMGEISAITGSFGAGGDVDIDAIQDRITTCTVEGTYTSPLPIIGGVVGGAIGAYPAYKLVKSMREGKYIRSMI